MTELEQAQTQLAIVQRRCDTLLEHIGHLVGQKEAVLALCDVGWPLNPAAIRRIYTKTEGT